MFTCTGMVGDGLYDKPVGVRRDDVPIAFATCEVIRKIDHVGSADFQRRLEWRYHENARSAADPFAIGGRALSLRTSSMTPEKEAIRAASPGALLRQRHT